MPITIQHVNRFFTDQCGEIEEEKNVREAESNGTPQSQSVGESLRYLSEKVMYF
jgi:hypothetical protein